MAWVGGDGVLAVQRRSPAFVVLVTVLLAVGTVGGAATGIAAVADDTGSPAAIAVSPDGVTADGEMAAVGAGGSISPGMGLTIHDVGPESMAFAPMSSLSPSQSTTGVSTPASTDPAQSPTAEFTWEPTEPFAGQEVTFDASDSDGGGAGIIGYQWSFGDGSGEQTSNPQVSNTFDEPGTYEVQLQVWNDLNENDATTEAVTVAETPEPPTADFEWEPEEPFVGQETTFDATLSEPGDGEIVEYRWQFGDGATEVTSDPITTHVHEFDGPSEMSLEIEDEFGQVDGVWKGIEVTEPDGPTAVLEMDPAEPVAGQEVTFDASDSEPGDGDIVEYRWDFDGDGTVDEVTATPVTTHVYPEPDGVAVGLTVVDEFGSTAMAGQEFSVDEPEGPTAAFEWDPEVPFVGEETTFDASDSTSGDGEIVEYRWQFGDGATEVTSDPVTTHVHEIGGELEMQLEVEDEYGQTDDVWDVIFVDEPEGPTAVVEWDPNEPVAGQSVTFDASDSEPGDGEIVEYRWDFTGDGTVDETTADPVTTHVYTESGVGTVTVTVVDEYEKSDSTGGEFPVVQPDDPVAAFEFAPTAPTVDTPVTFDASDSVPGDGEIEEYQWDFGDGSTEVTSDPEITHAYDAPGWYGVELTVVDSAGGTDDAAAELEVVPAPMEVACTASAESVSVGEEVVLEVSASGEAVYAEFDVNGDGTIDEVGEDLQATVTYDEPGTYEPRVVVYDEYEQPYERNCGEVVVEESTPTAAFVYDPAEPETNETVTFDASDSESPAGDIVEYRWDFTGDGTVDETTADPVIEHVFTESGTETVTLTVVDEAGNVDETSEEVAVEQSFAPPDVPLPDVDRRMAAIGLAALAGLAAAGAAGGAALLYGTGGSGGGDGRRPTTPPKPPGGGGGDDGPPYETGVIEVSPDDGPVSVHLGFEPALLTFTATDTAGGDVTDVGDSPRSSNWSAGVAAAVTAGGEDGDDEETTIEQYVGTVADDARSTERGTVTTRTDAVFELVRHDDDRLGRLRGRVTDVGEDGFTVSVRSIGRAAREPVRVVYRAFSSDADVEVECGLFETAEAPGRDVVDLGIDASVVELTATTADAGAFAAGSQKHSAGASGSAAPSSSGGIWTTDRTIGVASATVVAAGPDETASGETDTGDSHGSLASGILETVGWAGFASPRRANHTGAWCGTDRALSLAYHDGDRIAGHTRASVETLGERVELHYDRVYSGPAKLDPLGRHPVSYVAMATDDLRPAVGVVEAPAPGEHVDVDCGFEPGMVEVTTCRAPAVGEERATGAEATPFDFSGGTAIVRESRLAQYCVDPAIVGIDAEKARTDNVGAGTDDLLEQPTDIEPPTDRVAVADGGEEEDADGDGDRFTGPIRRTAEVDTDGLEGAIDGDAIGETVETGAVEGANGASESDDGDESDKASITDVASGPDLEGVTAPDLEDVEASNPSTVTPSDAPGPDRRVPTDDVPTVDVPDAVTEPGVGTGSGASIDPDAAVDPTDAATTADPGNGGTASNGAALEGDTRIATCAAIDDDGVVVGRDDLSVVRVREDGFTLATDGYRVEGHEPTAERRPYVCYRAWPAADGSGSNDAVETADATPSTAGQDAQANDGDHA